MECKGWIEWSGEEGRWGIIMSYFCFRVRVLIDFLYEDLEAEMNEKDSRVLQLNWWPSRTVQLPNGKQILKSTLLSDFPYISKLCT